MLGGVSIGSGVFSGIDFRSVVDALIQAQRAPIQQIQARIDTFTRAKESFSELETKLNDFKAVLEDLNTSSTIAGRTTSLSDETAGIAASAGATAALGSYSIDVTQLAQASRVRSDGKTDRFSPLVSDGTITIKAGSNDTITIDVSEANGNNSLQAIADTINDADEGVVATIVNDGTNDILIVRSEQTGAANALTITDTTDLDLDSATNVLQSAQDATLTIDGVSVTSSSNTVTGAIQGVTLTLTSTTASPVTLTVAEDTESTKQALQDFVDAYNAVNDYFQNQFGSELFQSASAVAGNGVVRNIQRQIQGVLTGDLIGIPDGKLDSIAELGVTVADGTGRLEFSASTFDDVVEAGRFDEVRAVLQASGSTTDAAVIYDGASSRTVPGTYAITVTTAPEKAKVTGSTAIDAGGLNQDENLTITVNGSSTTVALLKDDTLSVIVGKINSALDAAGLEASAIDDGGKLSIIADDYGSAFTVKAVSDVADTGDGKSTGIGTTELTDTGVDVAGTLGGQAADGSGNVLIGADGTDMDGLRVKVFATATSVASKGGDFGSVGFSQGLADKFVGLIDDLTDPLDGIIKIAKDGFDASIESNQERIDAMERLLTKRQEILIRQFSAAESAIAQLQQMQASLGARI